MVYLRSSKLVVVVVILQLDKVPLGGFRGKKEGDSGVKGHMGILLVTKKAFSGIGKTFLTFAEIFKYPENVQDKYLR